MASRNSSREAYNEYYRKYRAAHREEIRERHRLYMWIYRRVNGYHNEQNSKKRYPEKEKARGALRRAIARGEIKLLPCSVCSSPHSQAHHEDYSKPFDVIWLCAAHHSLHEQRVGKKRTPLSTSPLH